MAAAVVASAVAVFHGVMDPRAGGPQARSDMRIEVGTQRNRDRCRHKQRPQFVWSLDLGPESAPVSDLALHFWLVEAQRAREGETSVPR
jgi:hypothetical protein